MKIEAALFDSDSENDEDYVPPEDERIAEKDANNDGNKSDDSENATGVEALKRRKR